MATFSGDAAGYRIDLLDSGKIRVVDIDASDGDTGKRVLSSTQELHFSGQAYGLEWFTDIKLDSSVYDKSDPAITALADGGVVVTWTSWNQDGEDYGVYAQHFDAAGNALGGETRINTGTAGNQYLSAIAALADGGYVITWSTYVMDGSAGDVQMQRFDEAGNAVGEETCVNTTKVGYQGTQAIAALADGGYVITWTSSDRRFVDYDVYAQRYDAAGNKVGGETRVNTTTTDNQGNSVVTASADGGYVIVWTTEREGYGSDIYAQRFDAAGNAVGGEARIGATPLGNFQPAVEVLSDGGYVISWTAREEDGSWDIHAQHFDAAGNAVGVETRINTHTAGSPYYSEITALADGDYVVTWVSDLFSELNIYAQRYDAAGEVLGDEIHVNSAPLDRSYGDPGITTLADGGYVITWHRESSSFNGGGIYARYFDKDGNSAPTGLVLNGTDQDNVINGGTGAQIIDGKAGNDTLNGGSGNDIFVASEGDDVLSGGKGNDRLYDSQGSDTLSGGAGDDYLYSSGLDGHDTLRGGSGDDDFYAISGRDVLHGGAGNDYFYVANSHDVVYGGAGNDTIYGASGRKTLYGGAGNDYLSGSLGDDTLSGGAGNDTLYGARGNDVMSGGNGDDILIQGISGSDSLTGGHGSDIFRFNHSGVYTGNNLIVDFSSSEGDLIQLKKSIYTKLVIGALSADNFAANADGAAQDADDYVLYETDTGKLFYDADGSGAGGKIQLAVIGKDAHATLTAADFEVI